MRAWWLPIVLLQILGGGVNEKNKEGAGLYEEGKLDEALVAFTQAQEQSPDAPEIHYNIGNVHFRKQEMDKALEEYRTALNGSPEVQARSHYNSGNVHYRGQSYPEAIDAYKQALGAGDQDVEARQNLEIALQKLEEQQQQDRGDDSEEGDQEQQDRQDQEGQQDPSQGEQDQQQDPSQAPPRDQQTANEGEEAQPQGMSREEAERILAALAEMERAEQRKQQENQRTRTPGSGRDW